MKTKLSVEWLWLSAVAVGAWLVPMTGRALAAAEAFNASDYNVTTATSDNTGALQAAINACQKAGGGVVQLAAGTFKFKGTLRLDANNVWLRGAGGSATELKFDNGAADCITVGKWLKPVNGLWPPDGQTQGNRITDLRIVFGKKTAGRTVAVVHHADFFMEKVVIDRCVVGFYAERVNNTVLRDVIIYPDNDSAVNRPDEIPWSSWVGVWWDTPPNPKDPWARSDGLVLDQVVVNCRQAPGTGILWDGMCHTMIVKYANILCGKYGFRVINSRGAKDWRHPTFLNAFALLLEAADTDLSIEAGDEFKFNTCDFDMCKGNTVQVLPDPATGTSCGVQVSNSRIGNCQKSALYLDCRDVQLNNVELFSASLAGKDKYPAIILGPHARDVMMCNVSAEEFIGKRWASYAISIERGAKNIMIDNLNACRVNRGAIEDKGAVNLKVGHVIEPEDAK